MSMTVVFDLGGVLIDWNPRYLYRKLFDDDSAMEAFLTDVCSPAWNVEQDAGRTIADANAAAIDRHPDQQPMIEAYYQRFDEMMAGPLHETVAILDDLRQRETPLYALTNWSAETFPAARRRFEFLDWFQGILVSGEEKVKKPDQRIFQRLGQRFDISLDRCVFIDDSQKNVEAARGTGMQALHFTSGEALRRDLQKLALL